MRKEKYFALIFVLLLVLLFGNAIRAQEPGWPGCGRGEERARNLESLRLLKLMEALELNDEQSTKFISLFVDFRKEMRGINDDIQTEIDHLSELLSAEKPSEDSIKTEIARIEALKSGMEDNQRKFHTEVSKLLTVVQMGKMVVFEMRFERELIMNVRGLRTGQMPPLGP
ncbi:MAG: periplasmic heavy metal sensor [candidate division Zixibacteria bacterium]|nr:periplasmic heavy metal sensor [candidate division Zixibacteria bacterium]